MDEKEFTIQDEIDETWEAYYKARRAEEKKNAKKDFITDNKEEVEAAIEYGKKIARIRNYKVAAAIKNILEKIGFKIDETDITSLYMIALIQDVFYARNHLISEQVLDIPADSLGTYSTYSFDDEDSVFYDILSNEMFETRANIFKLIEDAKAKANLDGMSTSDLVFTVVRDLMANPEELLCKKRKR